MRQGSGVKRNASLELVMHFFRSLTAKTGAPEPRSRGPIHGDATAEARMRHAE